jgi:hypothetical protein
MPIPGVYVAMVLLMLLSCEVGFRLGVRGRSSRDRDASESLGPMVGGLLGMLGFVLAFTFSMAASQHDLRKHNVLDEANIIGTAYLRTDLVQDPAAIELRQLLREYVDLRLAHSSGEDLDEALVRNAQILSSLWSSVSALAVASPNTNSSLVVQSTNDVIDMHEKRLTGALHNRIPRSVWLALMAITSLTMLTMGLQVGLDGRRRFVAIVPLSLAFAVLVTLVVDLDRPQGGMIKVGQQAMIDLQANMAQPPEKG